MTDTDRTSGGNVVNKMKVMGGVALLSFILVALFQNFTSESSSVNSSSTSTSADIQKITFGNGPEFPGATGSLKQVAPTKGDSIFVLNYDFTKGGNYVAASMRLAAPVAADTVRFKINVPLQSIIYLRVTDESKQTLQFLVNHKDSVTDDTGWATVEVPVTSSSSFWGNGSDGELHGKIVSLSLGIGNSKRNSENIIGKGYFRQVQVLKKQNLKPFTSSVELASIHFNNGPEFPGASGALEVIPPKKGDSIQAVSYDFTQGGNYVGTHLPLVKPVTASYVRFSFKADSKVQVGLRVKDESGQTLQKIIPRKSLFVDADGWATATVDIRSSESHWGGVNSGKLQGSIHFLSLLIDKGSSKDAEGTAYFRQVEVLGHAPSMYHSTVIPASANLSQIEFSNGKEFPGAKGDMKISSDGTESIHTINFDLTHGNYVADVMSFANPVEASEVRFLAKIPKGLDVAVRVLDSEGQSFQTDFINRPFANLTDDGWRLYVVPLKSWVFHYGAANDGVFRGAVTRVTVILDKGRDGVSSLLRIHPSGTFYLKNISLGNDSGSRIDLKPNTIVYPALAKVNSNPALKTGVAFHARNDATYAMAQEIGFKYARTDVGWAGVESEKGFYRVKGFVDNVDRMHARGLTPVYILDYSNAKLYPPPTDFPIDLPAFQKYVAALTTALKGKDVVLEVWNEQNLWGFTPEQYAVLLRETEKTIHRIDPSREVISGGLAGYGFPYIYRMLDKDVTAGVSSYTIHPYTSSNSERIADRRAALLDMIASFGGTPSIATTEVGASTYWYDKKEPKSLAAESYQATTITRQILTGWASGERMTLIYQLQDSVFDPNGHSPKEYFFGLVGPHMEPKPSKRAVELLLKSTRIRTYQGVVTGSTNNIQAMKFTAPEKETLYVVWNNIKGTRSTFTTINNCEKSIDIFGEKVSRATSCILDLQSQPVPCIKNSNGTATCTITEAQGPVFVRMKK